ncbi:MAG: type II secretion system ATPase GspE [Anaeromicrobium sp.]|jgi:type IV pilus assembly protein PilB|uniref:type II secretion system ATPase GspE n=1 Tax=Anaeromicrobium sp. TaxID=1929132 RepID=UPI002600EE84|nr:type II secretion system ATPase GspE [Anaeromicrobium sp.]MCT4595187.1 type II secretion system ATPase GspE [Anaeromicrobium sp.]
MIREKKRLGDLLINAGFITEEQLSEALKLQRASGKKLGEILIDEGFVQENQMIEVLEIQLGIPHMDIEKHYIDPQIPRLISESLAKRHLIIPVKKEYERLTLAMSDPLNIFAMDDVKIATGLEIEPVIASRQHILNAIDQYYGKESAEKAVEDFKNQYNIDDTELDQETIDEINNAPVVRLVNSIIRQAVKAKASDIHIEPFESSVRVRFRVDGVLQEIMSPERSTHSAIVTRIKIMGKMNIAEKRVPQDGRVETNVDGKEVDLRISILPTVYGEKIVIRLLDRSNFLMSKAKLGFSQRNLEKLESIIKNPSGIVLVTGPTGSGKTTTLYTILRELNGLDKNIITVEDPVEYRLHGINQVQVNQKATMTFANALKSILRQDPDTIMIGEIRDLETAQIAVRASITGHLVLSTMHTNDSPSTVSRLMDMGVEPYLVSSSVVGVIAQRLVRKICDDCKESYVPNDSEKKMLNIMDGHTLYGGKGCTYCNGTGYRGRIAIHEVMPVNKEIRIHIDKRESIDVLRQRAVEQGMLTLKESCKELVLAGITTVEELTRVAYSLD